MARVIGKGRYATETYPEVSSGGPTGPTGPGSDLMRLIASGSTDVNDGASVILGPFTRIDGERVGAFIYPTNMAEGEHWGGEARAASGSIEVAWRFLRNEIADPNLQFNLQIEHISGTGTPRTVQWAIYGFSV